MSLSAFDFTQMFYEANRVSSACHDYPVKLKSKPITPILVSIIKNQKLGKVVYSLGVPSYFPTLALIARSICLPASRFLISSLLS